ncbi:MAG: aminotransferase class I/II-fold pyridoxal phosphate-dependent enzyme [Gammaproteobacteria bacterium]|nr:aminotransferase class I/II-fold pyridoxal phosphate-dependent enzyme [Gammaproteobacteria bacterium]
MKKKNLKQGDVQTWIIKRLQKALPQEKNVINVERSFAEYGLGSLQAVSLAGDLEKWLKKPVSPTLFLEHENISALSAFLCQEDLPTSTPTTPPPELKTNRTQYKKILTEFKHFPEIVDLENFKKYVRKKAGMDLFFQVTEGMPVSDIRIDGKKFINFSSYNYLDMASHANNIKQLITSVKRFGTSASASRLVGGEKPVHVALEKELSRFINTEACVVFNSGHATNVSTIGHMMKKNDLILLDKLSHNSIVQGALLSGATLRYFEHNDPQSLSALLTSLRDQYDRVLIVTEGVFSMDGDIAPIPAYIALKKKHHALLYVDEAHSIGVLGKKGQGIREYFNLKGTEVDFWMGTLSKALGSCGGYIAGQKTLIEYLKFSAPSFVYSCGLSPADTAAALASLIHLRKNPTLPAVLQARSAYFLDALQRANINTGLSSCTPVIPIMIGHSDKAIQLCAALRRKGLFLQALFYPAVEPNASRLRAFINCSHTEAQLRKAAKLIASEMHDLGLL